MLLDQNTLGEVKPWMQSGTVGFKPGRCLTSRVGFHAVDSQVSGLPGFDGAVYFTGRPGTDPRIPAIMNLRDCLADGDSGCLVVDTENEEFCHKPLPNISRC